ncbi:ABC transporter substrate-binding protein [Phytohabitans sp. LJ34]|uniref:ABC transporter substrate-binding protein n=1 Tax=Phytohabitans sp. LJ34 TaxID=3452217 RepID=UPI003F8C0C75
MWQGRIGVLALVVVAFLAGIPMCAAGGGGGDNQLEVYSWWTGPGEEEGLDAMAREFEAKNAGVTFVNAAVSGGAGSNAKAILASRLLANDPPDSYQRHAGLELEDDVRSGKVRDLTALYDREGWRDVLPKGLLDNLTIDGRIYAVPVNIHRANLMWYTPATLDKLGLAGPPKTWSEFLEQAEKIKQAGLTALAIGPQWTQKHLFETVLLGELGADRYQQLFGGSLRWSTPEVGAALATYQKVLSYSDLRSASGDWQPQIDRVVQGTAVYAVMGDWASGYLEGPKKQRWQQGYAAVASPGSDGVYSFLSDAFTLPTGARNPELAEKWLIECGSTEGQNLFNPKKGSIPARIDADAKLYPGYLGWALGQWRDKRTRIVGSLAHGVVANNAYNAEIDSALGLFNQTGDLPKLASTLDSTYEATR